MRILMIWISCGLALLIFTDGDTISRAQSTSPERMAQPAAINVYDVYAGLLADPPLSHANGNLEYAIVDTTASVSDMVHPDPNCRDFAREHPASFSQMQGDYERRKNRRVRLERKFSLAKPYVLISEQRADSFPGWGVKLTTADDIKTFSGVQDVIRLSDVFFDRDKKFAMVYMSAKCEHVLCGMFGWQILERLPSGRWQLDSTARCGSAVA